MNRMLSKWEEEECERREISSAIWEKVRYWCRQSNNPPILLSHESLRFDQFRMEKDGCYFRTNFLIAFTREKELLIREEYGPSHYFIAAFPVPELRKLISVNGRFIDVFSIEVMRKLIDMMTNASVSYLYL